MITIKGTQWYDSTTYIFWQGTLYKIENPSCLADAIALLANHVGEPNDGKFALNAKVVRKDVKSHKKYFI